MDQIKYGAIVLKEKRFKQLPSIVKIRIISMPKSDKRFYYYPTYNLFAQNNENNIHFYIIREDRIIKYIELTDHFQKLFDKKYTLNIEHDLYLEDDINLKSEHNVLNFYIDDMSRYQMFQTYQHQRSWKYQSISKHSFMVDMWINYKLRIYQLSNFKGERSIFTKIDIESTSYFSNIVQIRQKKFLYYLNRQTNKQIRNIKGFKGFLHQLNSNQLFVPIQKWIGQMSQVASVQIYDICSMKLKGILEVKPRKYKFLSYLFIKEHNILTNLYSKIIDFYDLTTLGFLGSELLNEEYQEKMYYDEQNGLTILKKLDTWIRQ